MIRQFPSKLRFVSRLVLVTAAMGAAFAVPARAADATSCAADSTHRALDFWLGDWAISAVGGGPASTSNVSLDLDKCLVVERWDGGRGHTGENIFAYSDGDQSWHGIFADNQGHVHVFVDGKVAAGSAEFTGPSRGEHGETVLNRITIRRISSTQAEQSWEKSSDGGKTWSAQFNLDYTRKP
jgi:hypothetical protein